MDLRKSIILLILVTIVAFLPVLSAEFVNWDDDAHILQNKLVQNFTPAEIPKIFLTANSANNTYIPLTTLSWGLQYSLFGKNPLVFHLTDLLLHIAVVLVVFALAQRFGLGPWGALGAALVFALHPSRVENVAWATARKDLLYGLFYFLAIGQYLIYLERLKAGRGRSWLWPYAAALACGLLSILSKPMALSLPWVLLLVDWMRKRTFSWSMLLDKVPFFLLIEPVAWITYAQNTRAVSFHFPDGFLVWFWSAAFYIQKFIWPGNLSPVYGLPEPISLANPVYWISLAILALAGVALWRWAANRWLVFALSFYVLGSFFLWRFDGRDISVVADRFLYVPSLAACLALGAVVDYFMNKTGRIRQIAVVAFGFVILACAASTFVYAFAWQNGFALWSSVTENSPALAFAYNNRGALFVRDGDNEKGLAEFHKAIEVASRSRVFKDGQALLPAKAAAQYASAHYNMGLLRAKEKDYEAALKHFNTAIYYELDKPEYYNNRGVTLAKMNQKAGALSDYNAALALDSDLYEARINRGLFYYKNGQKKEALVDFEYAVKIDPSASEGFMQAGRIYFEEERFADAQKMFEGALKAEPDHAQASYNLGNVFARLGDKSRAQVAFSQAQMQWLKDPEKYTLPGLDPKDAAVWAKRLGK